MNAKPIPNSEFLKFCFSMTVNVKLEVFHARKLGRYLSGAADASNIGSKTVERFKKWKSQPRKCRCYDWRKTMSTTCKIVSIWVLTNFTKFWGSPRRYKYFLIY